MDSTCDVFLTNLPKNISEVVVKNLFALAGKVLKVKIIDDKRNENQKLCFVGFATMDEALEAVRIADNSDALGDPIKASISKKCLENIENPQNRSMIRNNNLRPQLNNCETPNHRLTNVGRGRGLPSKMSTSPPVFKNSEIKLTDIKLKLKELIDVEIIELNRIDYILARPIKCTENSKMEISELLSKINANKSILVPVDSPKVGDCYLAKWDDDCYYRAELLEIINENSFKVVFVDEGTSGDVVSDIKHIPNGPLQQYPKQFLKLSIGCPNVENLKTFIIQQSEEKVVKVYWLGEFTGDSIPLINLFLNEDEIIEKYSQTNKIYIREKFFFKFDDLPVHRVGKYDNLIFMSTLYKSKSEFILQIKDGRPILLNNKKCPPVLPTPGDICIYEKRTSNSGNFFRCRIKRRQLFSFDIHLIDTSEIISNVNIDNLYTPEEIHKIDPPHAIECELERSVSGDDIAIQKMLSGDVLFNINQYEKNNHYIVSLNIPAKKNYEFVEVNYDDFLGKGYKVTVSHAVSPINFYVQIDRDDYFLILSEIQEMVNINYSGSSFVSIDDLKINQAVVAPFIVSGSDAEFFRAKVLDIKKDNQQVHVLFIDYGNDEWVKFEKLLNVNEELVARPGLALHCELDVVIKKEAWAHATDTFCQFSGLSDNDVNVFVMQVINIKSRTFVVDLVSDIKGSVTYLLEKSGTCSIRRDDQPIAICNGNKNIPKENGIYNKNVSKETVNCKDSIEDELAKKIIELERRINVLEGILLRK